MKKSRKKIYNSTDSQPFKLSRTKIELFEECPCCFYLDRKLGIAQPTGLPFSLNNAVDGLWKKEFDSYRVQGLPHPIAVANIIDAIPFKHEKIEDWRSNWRGIEFLHEPTRFLIHGAVDDVWVAPTGELIVVDVKATSKKGEVSLDADWQMGYKRQMEIYQWILRNNGFQVSQRGYFIYCNGKQDEASSGTNLAFGVSVIPYDGDTSWIEGALHRIKECLSADQVPAPKESCKLCAYRHATAEAVASIALSEVA